MNWRWDLFFEAIPIVSKGLYMLIGLTFSCFAFALIFGFVWTLLKRIPIKPINWIVTWTMEFIRSTPPLIQLFFIFYALPTLPYIGETLTFSPFICGTIGLGLHFSTYISEVYRSGIESVDNGQWEAAKALNFSTAQKWTKVILPQALPPTIPMLGNYFIILFKEVPLAATIGVVEILHLANTFGSQHFRYLESLTIVALLFLIISYPSAILIRKLEEKMNRRFDKKEVIQESKGAVMNG
ncbi:ectoine/hydroxyectoine ABC transporter permease subunit EhuD [Virgibacillus soli]|uniref:Ectoine/hydroxyectoine ABC transporter permease subunit EhuD n=1 Tax=Paracerasibacillus soli TaxID=480284 RepID=A0ABU5CX26_9BACI|nr:ectoine/hydroxyectoine ABC transporter permease subunit EhuD [Virgibacillus soli]MDY0410399.1 ectoine/hydroxyectoine ABC transporter permease subunit EhuD [Virgibacillus soli]